MTPQGERKPTFEGWAILELMGHRRLAGIVAEATIAGGAFIRVDVPNANGSTLMTQFYAPGAVYCITPTTEETARAVARESVVEPLTRWDARRLLVSGDPPPEARDADQPPFGPDGEEY